MRNLVVAANLMLLGLVCAAPIQAADAPAAKAAMPAEAAQGTGVVNKVDLAKGVVNIAHEPIAALKWPAMTMDFKVADKKLLDGLKPGQKVSFGIAKDAKAGFVISRIAAGK